jgi:acyl carrier protein
MNESVSSVQAINITHEIRSFIVNSFLSGQTDKLQDHEALLGNVIDSTGVLELVNFLQERFAITVEDEEVNPENLSSVNNLVVYVTRKLDGRNA